jgi:hypothetical protein
MEINYFFISVGGEFLEEFLIDAVLDFAETGDFSCNLKMRIAEMLEKKECFIRTSAGYLAYYKISVLRLEINGENRDTSWRIEGDGKYVIQFSVSSMAGEVFSFRALLLAERGDGIQSNIVKLEDGQSQ